MPNASFLSPNRSGLAEVRAVVAPFARVDEAWAHLAKTGRIPTSWIDSPSRVFIEDARDDYDKTMPTRDPARTGTSFHPATLEQAALFASDVAGVEAAEAAMLDLVDALVPWGAKPVTRVAWWTIPRARFEYVSTDTRPWVIYALPFAFVELHRVAKEHARPVAKGLFGHARDHADAWAALLADRPNPFAPLARIEATGYVPLEYVGPTGTAILVSPAP